jgi:hypothetical protein
MSPNTLGEDSHHYQPFSQFQKFLVDATFLELFVQFQADDLDEQTTKGR